MRRKNTPHGRPIWKKFRLIWTKEPAKRRFLCSFFQSPSRGWKKSTEQHLFLSCRVFRASLSLSLSLFFVCWDDGRTKRTKKTKKRTKKTKKSKERKKRRRARAFRPHKKRIIITFDSSHLHHHRIRRRKKSEERKVVVDRRNGRERERDRHTHRERTINKKR